ncbi:NAD(P)-binding protein [Aspergillus sclerotiicarbonarius CBS 121057]|uniref:NAD(P)-binding protein n=1 Tax=Aspergillus sclerotiicarbonarius (strain CBS 121057 / IBT 28362) TaxID=1448318 RepID=A0A319EQI5_ASPSB|nr:NAD(P)-binding protein [Aspergillus sclerotiicarbonarius CBS 121057]
MRLRQPPTPPLPPSTTFTNRTAIITGSNTGIGLSTARHLLSLHPKTLILACRNTTSATSTRSTLLSEFPSTTTTILIKHLDLSTYASVRSFAKEIRSEVDILDLLVLNAGSAFFADFKIGEEGRERTVQNMFLCNALLVLELLDKLTESKGRVTWVGSRRAYEPMQQHTLHNIGSGSGSILDLFDQKEGYDMMRRYGEAKFLCLGFFYELARRVKDKQTEGDGEGKGKGKKVVVNMVCPGAVRSSLARNLPLSYRPLVWLYQRLVSRSPEEGAVLVLNAGLVVGEESHGVFFGDDKVERMHPFFESQEGKQILKSIWQETMAELKKVVVIPEYLLAGAA